MFFLAGLMGMMVLGSVAFISTPLSEDEFSGDAPPDPGDAASPGADDPADGDGQGTGILDFAMQADGVAASGGYDPVGAIDSPFNTHEDSDPMAAPQTEGQAAGDGGAGALSSDDDAEDAKASLFERMGLINSAGLIEQGGEGDDSMLGTEATDLLAGAGGDDVILSGGSDDEVHGNDGADTLAGGDGHDTLHGGADRDEVAGGAGDDVLFGHHGDDTLYGGAGDDEAWGGLDDDSLDGGKGADALHGREGADTLDGGPGQDTLFGGWDDDLLIGVERGADGLDTDDMDYLNGGDGADTLAIGSGDVASGGDGADVLVLGEWIAADAPAQLMDFDAGEDQIVIVYDDSTGDGDPTLEIRVSAKDPGVTEILVDGAVLTTLPTADAPTAASIVLVGESAAPALSLG